MIRLAAALLCDSANIRENLLSVLGGGITRIGRPDFPASINCDLALAFYASPRTSARDDHSIRVSLLSPDGEELYSFEAGFELDTTLAIDDDETVTVPLVIPLGVMGVPNPGNYQVEVRADGELLTSVPFRVDKIE